MGGVKKQITDNLFVLQYIFDCFTFYGSDDSAEGSEDSVQNPDREGAVHNPEEDTHALKYEIEYLVAGNNTDKKNLSYVVNRLLFIRFATNFLHACTSPKLLPVVEGVSDILGGLLGFPAAAVAVKFIILASLSIGETYIDMRTLMHGEGVPVTKNDATWNLFLENITSCFKKGYVAKQGSVNVSYNDFLLLLLLKNWKGTRIYYRMMDIMQVNVALEESGFEMRDCIFSYQWDWKLSCPTWFRVIPSFGVRIPNSFTRSISKICTY